MNPASCPSIKLRLSYRENSPISDSIESSMSVVIHASMELALVVVLGADIAAAVLEAFVEAVDSL